MPRVTDAHKTARRTQIMDAARACFARKGFQLSTIRELERESKLSSGAIFNYFPTKLDIFIALAEEDTIRTADLWRAGGLRGVVNDHANGRSVYTASYLEVGRQLLTDPNFQRRWERRGQPIVDAIRQWLIAGQHDGRVRQDLPIEHLVTYCVIALDGTMLQLRLGTPGQELDTTLDLFEQALHPRQ